MTITSVSGVSNAAANTAILQTQAQLRAAATLTLANANSASAALQSIVDNATRTALIGRSPSFVANLEGASQTAPSAPAAANATTTEPAAANTPNQTANANENVAPAPTFNAAPTPVAPAAVATNLAAATPTEEAAAQSTDAQADLVERRIAHDIAAAFNVVMTDQTYSAAATALYLQAAAYRLQVDRPKEPDLATPGPVQPIKPITAVESSTSSSLSGPTR
jgi:hypothetical protein